jgi:hypothetical protein
MAPSKLGLDWKEWQGIQQWKLACWQKAKAHMGCFGGLWKDSIGKVHELIMQVCKHVPIEKINTWRTLIKAGAGTKWYVIEGVALLSGVTMAFKGALWVSFLGWVHGCAPHWLGVGLSLLFPSFRNEFFHLCPKQTRKKKTNLARPYCKW